jgi:hypothetical protein
MMVNKIIKLKGNGVLFDENVIMGSTGRIIQ